jgi:hypothetical protein
VQQHQQSSFELLSIDPLYDSEGWRYVEVAVDGVRALPFAFHKTVAVLFPTEDSLMSYLCRQAKAMIERYGDARRPKQLPVGEVN